ncbi:MAG: nitrogen regulation protein NR(II) [Acidobacteriota bacterium]
MNHQDKAPEGNGDQFAADLVRSMRCGLITVDKIGRIRSINDRATSILDVKATAAVGEPAAKALSAHPNLARLLSQALSLKTLPDRAEMEIRTRDRDGQILGFTLSRVLGRDGSVQGAAIFFKDLTPIEREEERQQLQERLASLGAMASSLAHEIRNPLAALEVTASLLKRRLAARGEEIGMVQTLQEQIRRLSGTVNSCLEFVRPLRVQMVPLDLVPVLENALQVADCNDESIRVIRQFPQDVRPVLGDAGLLGQALLNLVRNALEAMAEHGGVLKISLEVPPPDTLQVAGTMARLSISDSGPGIPEDIRQKIFNPFFSTKSNGSGLGLAWTRKVIDAHGGMIDVDSHTGRGSVFIIRLPLPAAASAPELFTTGEMLQAQDPGC